ncbi:MAG: hypothetical protein H8E44_00960, partial [Planctomycetes bacterium]|nr:hypothetical protein [Planctomycetota bacterium]
ADDFGAGAQDLGNLLVSERNVISVGGDVDSTGDVDWYQFALSYTDLHSSDSNSNAAWSTIFDLDYADQLERPDTTLSVFDSSGRLVYVGRESNVADDRSAPNEGLDLDDLSRGSVGGLDPFIGPVDLIPAGDMVYYVAVSSDGRVPAVLDGYFQTTATDPNARLEPIDSIQRVVEDHLDQSGYTSNSSVPVAPETSIFDLSDDGTALPLQTHVIPWTLDDVSLYVTTVDNLTITNPFVGNQATYTDPVDGLVKQNQNIDVNGNGTPYGSSNEDMGDIVMRSDGVLYGVHDLPADVATVGARVTIDGGNAALGTDQKDSIPGRTPTPGPILGTFDYSGSTPSINERNQVTTSDTVDAITYERLRDDNSIPVYRGYYAVREQDQHDDLGVGEYSSKLYRFNPDDGSAAAADMGNSRDWAGVLGDIQPSTVNKASDSQVVTVGSNSATIEIEAKAAGTEGNNVAITIVGTTGGHNDSSESLAVTSNVAAKTITVQLGFTFTRAATIDADTWTNWSTVGQVVDAINNDAGARELVTAGVGPNSTSTTQTGTFVPGTPYAAGPPVVAATQAYPVQALGSLGTGTTGGGTPLSGYVTGLAMGSYTGGTLYGVTSAGEVLSISKTDGEATILNNFAGVSFQGLALGPQHVADPTLTTPGFYSQMLFAVDDGGILYALDTNGDPVANIFDTQDGGGNPGSDGVGDSSTLDTGVGSATGLAFSTLDFNLWHPTTRRGSDTGHGINTTPDNSRSSVSGGTSFYFGLDQYVGRGYLGYDVVPGNDGQYGNSQSAQLDLSSNAAITNTYNLPGGAFGTLQSTSFSLAGRDAEDKPTLYFNYLLETQDAGGGGGEMRDSARVFITRDGGVTWELLATNNSSRGANTELPRFASHNATAALGNADSSGNPAPVPLETQQVQELFDTHEWRQARIDLSAYVGESNLELRFDFSTAGNMNEPNLPGEASGNFFADSDDNAVDDGRGENNQKEGFFVDDLIVGFSERGEMVTGLPVDADRTFTSTPTNPVSVLIPLQRTGEYQFEVRRGPEYAESYDTGSNTSIRKVFDTNDRIVRDSSVITPSPEDRFTGNVATLPWMTSGNSDDRDWRVTNDHIQSGPTARGEQSVLQLT